MKLEVRNLSIDSDWQEGLPWMKVDTIDMPVIDTIDMPVTRYDQLTTDKATEYEVQKECFDEPFQLSANFSSHKVELENQVGYLANSRQCVELLLDPIKFGWNKSLKIITIVLLFITNKMFRINQRRDQKVQEETIQRKCGTQSKVWCPNHGKQVHFLYESNVIRAILKPNQLERLFKWYFFLPGEG